MVGIKIVGIEKFGASDGLGVGVVGVFEFVGSIFVKFVLIFLNGMKSILRVGIAVIEGTEITGLFGVVMERVGGFCAFKLGVSFGADKSFGGWVFEGKGFVEIGVGFVLGVFFEELMGFGDDLEFGIDVFDGFVVGVSFDERLEGMVKFL
jgi:hypothetical protein